MHLADNLIGFRSQADHEGGKGVREAAVSDPFEFPAIDHSCGHVCPFLIFDFAPQDINHAIRGIGGEERDLWILLF